MRRRLSALALVAVTASLIAVPAQAAPVNISIVSVAAGFSPTKATGAFGTTFTWTNDDGINHTTTQNASLSLWNSGSLSSGETFSKKIDVAGTYPYHCAIHPTMTGTVRVPVRVNPASGSASTTFTVAVASVAAPKGFVYDVQRRKGGGRWTIWKSGLTKKSVRFDPPSSGSWSFRSRLHKTKNDATSRWSPARSVSVS